MAEPSQAPLVSVVSAFHNRSDSLVESVESLLSQSYEPVEVIIVDDGSTDDTYTVLRRFRDPRLRLIRQENRGFVFAIRHAIEQSRGEYVAIHGAGDISLPQRIERQVAVLASEPAIGMVGCHVETLDLSTDRSTVLRPRIDRPARELFPERNPFTHGEVMFRRSVYDRVGGYRPFFTYAQDRDLWLRMCLHAEIAVVEEILYQRKLYAEGASQSVEKRLLQRYLSEFAVQLFEQRLTEGEDALDRIGPAAGVLRRRTERLSRELRMLARAALIDGNAGTAERFVRAASLERRRPYDTALLAVMARMTRSPALRDGASRAMRFASAARARWRALIALRRRRDR